MQEPSPPPMPPSPMPFGEFLVALFQALDREGMRYCVLRNYEGFPDKNIGSDIDLLISPSQLSRAMRALRSIGNIRIVGYTLRSSVLNLYLEGILRGSEFRSLQVDFITGLNWKGLPYLPVGNVLQASPSRRAGALDFFVPSPVHEAISSLFNSLVIGGQLKEKYFLQIQQTFAGRRYEVIAALSPQFGMKAAARVVDAVIEGRRRKILECVRSLRVALFLRNMLRNPLRGTLNMARHYAREFTLRYSLTTLETVAILAPDSSGKSALVEDLTPLLQSTAKYVQIHHGAPRLPLGNRPRSVTANADFHAGAPRGSLISMARSVQWLLEEWLSQFAEKKNLTLRILDGSYAGLLIDPKGHGYGGPMWFARLIGRLFPSPDLWILLDPEGLQSRGREAPSAEALRRVEACRAFVKARKNSVILDAGKPIAGITEEAYAAIIETLAQRADSKLRRRF
jgi:hypothetical protein